MNAYTIEIPDERKTKQNKKWKQVWHLLMELELEDLLIVHDKKSEIFSNRHNFTPIVLKGD